MERCDRDDLMEVSSKDSIERSDLMVRWKGSRERRVDRWIDHSTDWGMDR